MDDLPPKLDIVSAAQDDDAGLALEAAHQANGRLVEIAAGHRINEFEDGIIIGLLRLVCRIPVNSDKEQGVGRQTVALR